MVVLLPLIWVRLIDERVELDERLLSVGGRLLVSLIEFFASRPVEEHLFFVVAMSILFWSMGASAGFSLTRRQNFLAAVLPSAIGILIIQHYNNFFSGRIWFLAFFIFIALCLLGRLNFLQNRQHWRERRIFLSPENSLDLTSGMTIAAALLILTAWMMPLSNTRIETLRETWRQLTKPWANFTERLENAGSALESPSLASPVEFYGTELELGLGFPLSDAVMFRVELPELDSEQKPPRYYWRGRVYDYFSKNQWYITNSTRADFSPDQPSPSVTGAETGTRARFIFTTGTSRLSLLYAPSQHRVGPGLHHAQSQGILCARATGARG